MLKNLTLTDVIGRFYMEQNKIMCCNDMLPTRKLDLQFVDYERAKRQKGNQKKKKPQKHLRVRRKSDRTR